ncbi:conserved hypothetical protein [Deferribacter desulfuricans SSM1]|uniref:EamA domain-containing protein n=1 Tax=Deferribacter desulfuricans (strain DSM 14783 / JCM 11476 / NBRC 101012 / SSM1) TaxID=639282 RepID=D3PCH0_DEFDS|nr:DMT family transporter [Deferribacter desulfuricans]BAI80293.1 conserved hypothetical protein [Deferribacter desulfuricans SSM1]
MYGYFLILLSALFHSFWNVLLKDSENKYFFNFLMHLTNLVIFSIMYLLFFKDFLYFDKNIFIYSFIAATFFSGYHICLSTAYRYGEISSYYPIVSSSPVFVLIWAIVFLKEKLTISGSIAIFLIIAGVFFVGLVKYSKAESIKGVYFSLLAALFYSFGAIIDKIGVSRKNFILYIYLLTLFMTIYMYIFNYKFIGRGYSFYLKNYFWKILLGGFILFSSVFSYRYGLTMVNVSYAVFIRQANILFGLLFGYLIFREKIHRYKVVGAILIAVGVVIIKLNT